MNDELKQAAPQRIGASAQRSAFSVQRSGLKWLLIGLVVAYVGVIIVAPLAALAEGAFADGLGPMFAALTEPDVLSAF